MTTPSIPQSDLNDFAATIRKGQDRAKSAALLLDEGAPVLVKTLQGHSGQSESVRQIIWSLYTGSHLVPVGFLGSGLDTDLAIAVAAAITARLFLGADVEPKLKEIMSRAGEFERFDQAAKLTPEGVRVQYPLPHATAEELRVLAEAVERSKDN